MIGSYGYVATKLHKGKILMVGWGPDVLITPFKTPFHRSFIKKVLKRSARIVVDSNNMRDILLNLGVENSKIDVFPFGPSKEWYLFPKRERILSPLRIITHRKLEREYDPFTVLKALNLLDKGGIDFSFTFASFGFLEQELKQEIKKLNLEKKVRITGYQQLSTLIKELSKADIYVSASLSDSTSVSLLEAMALGLFPIVSDVKDNLEWIHPHKNGCIFKRGDVNGLVQCIINVLSMSEEDYKKVVEYNYDIIKKIRPFEENVLKVVEDIK